MTSWTYDALGRKLSETNQLSDMRYFEYDAAGRLTQQTDRLGRITRFGAVTKGTFYLLSEK